jgi:hypothetical protein
MEIMMEETFGPVVGIMKVESDEEALQLMNDSPYGLVRLLTESLLEKLLTYRLHLYGQTQTTKLLCRSSKTLSRNLIVELYTSIGLMLPNLLCHGAGGRILDGESV